MPIEIIQSGGGGGAAPGGSTGDIQFNNGGVFGGETLVPLAHGGTNADLSATGAAHSFLKQSSSGAAITVGTIGSGDIASGIVTWDLLGNAAANLTLANAAFTTTFNQTSAAIWLWANTTAAVAGGTNVNSPIRELAGAYFTSGASATDMWSMQNTVAASITSASVTNVAETAGNVVTLTITGGGSFVAGAAGTTVTFTGLTTATWLNNQNVVLTTASSTQLVFTDPTSHGTQASHAETGTVTQNNPTSTLALVHSGSATAQVQFPAPNAQSQKPTMVAAGTTLTGISIGTNASQPLQVYASGSVAFMEMFNGGTQTGALGGQITSVSLELSNVAGGPVTISGGIPAAANINTAVPRVSIGFDQSNNNVTTGSTNVVAINMGSKIAMGGDNSPWITWQPSAGTGSFTAVQITPTINQTQFSGTISSVTFTTTVATITVNSSTGLVTGQTVVIAGLSAANNTQLNGSWTLTSITNVTTITISSTWTAHTATGDSGTITQNNTGSYTALLVNPTETSVRGTANKLIDLQAGGTSRFNVDNTGLLSLPNSANTATSASAGANGAVPNQVVGYIIVTIAGTSRKIPYFAT